jgi:hypothetical protein
MHGENMGNMMYNMMYILGQADGKNSKAGISGTYTGRATEVSQWANGVE